MFSKYIEIFYEPLINEISQNTLILKEINPEDDDYFTYINKLLNLTILSNQRVIIQSYSENLISISLRKEIFSLFYIIHNSFFELKENEIDLEIIKNKLEQIYSLFNLSLTSQELSNDSLIKIIKEEMIVIQLLFEIITTMFQRYFSLKLINMGIFEYITFSTSLKKSQFIKDCYILYIIQKSLPWMDLIISYMEKLYFLIRKRDWNYSIISAQKSINIHKCEFYNFYIFIGIYGVIKKYLSINKNEIPIINEIINLENLNQMAIRLYHLTELDILYDYQVNKEILFNDLIYISKMNFESNIIYNNFIIDNLIYVEFLNLNFGFDYHTLFISSYDYLCDNIKNINCQLIVKFTNLINILHNEKVSKNELKNNMINFFILDSFLKSLKNLIYYHMTACFNNDTLCDCYVKNEWLSEVINCYCIVYVLKFIVGAIISNFSFDENNLFEKNNIIIPNITKIFIQLLNKDSILLPVKEFFFKERIIDNYLILFYHFISTLKKEIISNCNENILDDIRVKMIEFSHQENKLLFFLSNIILRKLKDNLNPKSYISKIRLILNTSKVLEFKDISQEISKKAIPSEFNGSNKENINILPNRLNNFNNELIENNLLTENKKKHFLFFSNVSEDEQFDITKYKESFNKNSLRDINNKFKLGKVNQKLILNIPLSTLKKSPLILINEDSGLNILTLENEKDILGLMNNKLYYSKNILDQLFSSLLYGESSFEEATNIQNTMQYYDINFEMEYLEFCEQIKNFIL